VVIFFIITAFGINSLNLKFAFSNQDLAVILASLMSSRVRAIVTGRFYGNMVFSKGIHRNMGF